jgi:hypothetical protein
MYFRKLVPEGILAVHTSNRHVDLVPVVADVARSIKCTDPFTGKESTLVARRAHDNSPFGRREHFTSEWVMVARSDKILDRLTVPEGYDEAIKESYRRRGFSDQEIDRFSDLRYWETAKPGGRPPWTNDYSNVLSVFRWR